MISIHICNPVRASAHCLSQISDLCFFAFFQSRCRECNRIFLCKALNNLIFSKIIIMFSKCYITLLQSVLIAGCPYIRFIGICIQNIVITEPQTVFFLILSDVTFYVHMLSKHQILRGIQFHIKRIRSRRCLIIGTGTCPTHIHIITAVIWSSIIHIYGSHRSFPCFTAVYSGTDDHCLSGYNRIPVLFINFTFHSVSTCTENCNKCRTVRTSVTWRHATVHCTAVIHRITVVTCHFGSVNFLYHTIYFTSNLCIPCCALKFINFRLFTLLTIFILLEIHFVSLDFNGIGQLIFGLCFFLLRFQRSYLFCQADLFIF